MSSSPQSLPGGADFSRSFDVRYDPAHGLQQGGVSDRQRDRLVREEHAKLRRQAPEPATVVNLNSFPLSVNLGELGMIEVEAAEDEQHPATLRIAQYRIAMRDLGDGNFSPVSVVPTELAMEVEKAYADNGGVFSYRGAGPIPADALANARLRLHAWYRQELRKAADSWSRYRQHKFITDRQRDAARALFALGELAEMPEWVTITRAQSDRRDCPRCGESIKRIATVCRFCRSEVGEIDAAGGAAAND